MKVIVCNCNPGISHQPIEATDTKILRRVRRDCLETADRWEREGGWTQAVICARYSAHLYLVRLRELAEKVAA
jgi:hypothetical protein